MKLCNFSKAWVGNCKNEKPCKEHAEIKCGCCGGPATKECDETGQFVCGVPLCDNCEHTIHEDGTNGGIGFNQQRPPEGMKSHCKKSEQKFKSWYER